MTQQLWPDTCKKKWIDPKDIEKFVAELKKQHKSIATLNGSFDLLHAGHLHIIFEASKQADILICAINTDSSIQRYKSLDRPIISLEYRLQLLSAISFIGYITWFEEIDPRAILSKICPDVHVNGAEYGEDCIEAKVVRANGGRLHLVDRIPGLATSEIISKIHTLPPTRCL